MESWDVRRNSFVGWHPPVAPTAQILWEGRSGSGDGAAAAGIVWVHLLAARNEGKRCGGAHVVSLWKSINYAECTACIQACARGKHQRAACWDTHGDPIILLSTSTMPFNLFTITREPFLKKTFALYCRLLIKNTGHFNIAVGNRGTFDLNLYFFMHSFSRRFWVASLWFSC